MVYVSFSTSDLRNWKNQKHPFSGIPRHSFLKTVFYTQFDMGLLPTATGYTVYFGEQDHMKQEVKKVVLGPDGRYWMMMIFLSRVYSSPINPVGNLIPTKLRELWIPSNRLFWLNFKHWLRSPPIDPETPEDEHSV